MSTTPPIPARDDPDTITTNVTIPGDLARRLRDYCEPLGLQRTQAMWALLDLALTNREISKEAAQRAQRARRGAPRSRGPLLEDGLPHD